MVIKLQYFPIFDILKISDTFFTKSEVISYLRVSVGRIPICDKISMKPQNVVLAAHNDTYRSSTFGCWKYHAKKRRDCILIFENSIVRKYSCKTINVRDFEDPSHIFNYLDKWFHIFTGSDTWYIVSSNSRDYNSSFPNGVKSSAYGGGYENHFFYVISIWSMNHQLF